MSTKASVLEVILNKVYLSKNLDEAKAIVKDHLEQHGSAMSQQDKHAIIVKSSMCSSLLSLQTYITNSYFKYQKMGLR